MPTVIVHVGDYDPSGLAIYRVVDEDVGAFVDRMSDGETSVGVKRAAVTPEQIERFALPTAPPKTTDKRAAWVDGDGTVQAEALPPDVLATEVRQAVETGDRHASVRGGAGIEASNREAIDEILRGLRGEGSA